MLLALCTLSASVAAPRGPRFSWDTLPVFFHSSNASGPFTAESVATMATFPMVRKPVLPLPPPKPLHHVT